MGRKRKAPKHGRTGDKTADMVLRGKGELPTLVGRHRTPLPPKMENPIPPKMENPKSFSETNKNIIDTYRNEQKSIKDQLGDRYSEYEKMKNDIYGVGKLRDMRARRPEEIQRELQEQQTRLQALNERFGITSQQPPKVGEPGGPTPKPGAMLGGLPRTLGPESFNRSPVRLPMPPAMQQPGMQQPGYAAGAMAQLWQMQQSPRNNFQQLRGMLNRPMQEGAQQMQQPVAQQQLPQMQPQMQNNQQPQEETEEERKRKLAGLNLNVL